MIRKGLITIFICTQAALMIASENTGAITLTTSSDRLRCSTDNLNLRKSQEIKQHVAQISVGLPYLDSPCGNRLTPDRYSRLPIDYADPLFHNCP